MLKYAAITLALLAGPAAAQTSPQNPVQNPAMAKLDMMKGVWKGEAKGYGPGGKPYRVTQTERVGPMLGGDVLVIEGRGYGDDKSLEFNAFGVVSYNAEAKTYEFRAYNAGHGGTFPLTLDGDKAVWETPAGPNAVMRFTMDFSTAGVWRETGQYVAAGQPPRPILDMTLKRIGDTEWPGGGAILP